MDMRFMFDMNEGMDKTGVAYCQVDSNVFQLTPKS